MKAWVCKSCTFDAAHTLPLHPGKCSKLHGHTYKVELSIECEVDPTTGMGIDMGDLDKFLEMNVIGLFDHSNLNDKFEGCQPTAENIADAVINAAGYYFNPSGVTIKNAMKIKVFETPDSWVEVERAA